jgi:hypothetical protein
MYMFSMLFLFAEFFYYRYYGAKTDDRDGEEDSGIKKKTKKE